MVCFMSIRRVSKIKKCCCWYVATHVDVEKRRKNTQYLCVCFFVALFCTLVGRTRNHPPVITRNCHKYVSCQLWIFINPSHIRLLKSTKWHFLVIHGIICYHLLWLFGGYPHNEHRRGPHGDVWGGLFRGLWPVVAQMWPVRSCDRVTLPVRTGKKASFYINGLGSRTSNISLGYVFVYFFGIIIHFHWEYFGVIIIHCRNSVLNQPVFHGMPSWVRQWISLSSLQMDTNGPVHLSQLSLVEKLSGLQPNKHWGEPPSITLNIWLLVICIPLYRH